MKTHLSLGALAKELERQKAAKLDYIAELPALRFETDKNLPILSVRDKGDHLVRPHAHGQIAAKLGIPKPYYDRMLGEAPELLATNVNRWLGASTERGMVRVLDDEVRALVSDRYQRIENDAIAEVALPILMEQPEMQVISSSITERKLYIKALFPRVQGEVKKGDVVQSGVVISNSEVGAGAVKVEPLVYRLVCLNGMILPQHGIRGYHVGARAAEGDAVYELLSDEARAADDKAILLKARDVIRALAAPESFAKIIARMKDAAGDKLSGDPAKAVEVLAQQNSLTENERGSVLRHLIEGGDLSRWGFLNAVTRTANDHVDYDRATELETMGGTILDLPKDQWRAIADAA